MQEVTPEKENQEVTESISEEEILDPTADVDEEGAVFADDDDEDEDEEEIDADHADALARVEELEDENTALKTRVLRAQADLENFKKRAEREKQESIKFTRKSFFSQILDVLDNFDRALTAVTDPKDNFVIGVNMIHKQLLDVLSQNGVEEIQAVGRAFDPYLDEAIAKEVTTEHEENTILEVFLKGYRFQGTLLRATKVKVAVRPDEERETPEEVDVEAETSSQTTATEPAERGETEA